MPGYEITQDCVSGIIICRLLEFMAQPEAKALATEMLAVTANARRRTPALRILLDNHRGVVLATPALDALATLRTNRLTDDRVAIVVASALAKRQTMRSMSEGSQVFTSEVEAKAWLLS